MGTPLRVLIVEDNADDAELVIRRLSRAQFDVDSERVEEPDALRSALEEGSWDVVLADYSMPGFSGLDALEIVGSSDVDLPVILVSGAIDVPTALGAMKAGAKDFVLKDDTSRLPSVVEREVAEAGERRHRRLAEAERDSALRELQQANQQLSDFAGITDIDLRGVTIERLLDDLLSRLVSAINADGITIMLAENGVFVAKAAAGAGILHVGEPSALEFAARVASQDRPIVVEGAQADPALSEDADGTSRSTIGVPMHYAGQVVGVLRADWSSFQVPDWQLPLLEIAADRCAIAIENVALYQREHSIAETLQLALLSGSTDIEDLEVGQVYASATVATLVGGDFYDIFEACPGSVALTIGDVSGKGVEAAVVTALVKNAVRTLAHDCSSPEVVMTRANPIIARFTDGAVFVTGVYGVLDVHTGELRYTSAGHPPPFILGPSGVRSLDSHGPLLGALEDVEYACASELLAPGESLVLYTDGILEARSPDGKFFGPDRLSELLSSLAGAAPQQIATSVFEAAWEFSAENLRDDIAVLVLRPRLGDGAGPAEAQPAR